ncbi:hypothetical protein [Kordia jejudonensis]|uniref:hypothetical protein n=1 Tax=Kordia jejudonensis TaxID=1348245 RepID=UPI0006294B37|nr:hypothetical protein [Kordia jejudonensis]
MKKITQICTIILIAFFLSCTSDSNNEEDMNDPVDPSTELLLKRTVTQDDSGDDYIINYLYNGNKLIGYNESDTFNVTYTYENELLVRIDAYIGNIQETYTTITYGADNILTEYTIYYVLGNVDSATRHVLTYLPNNQISTKSYRGTHSTQNVYISESIDTFSNGNWTKRFSVDYGDEEVFLYDTKNGTLKNIHLAFIFQLLGEPGEGATNNPVALYNGETRLEYVYNANDYPVSSLGYEEGNNLPVTSTQYFYE